MKLFCSRCYKPLDSIVFNVKSSVTLYDLREGNFLKSVENTSEATNEVLCQECFDKYADCLNELTKDVVREDINISEIVDGIQYE